MVKSVSSSRKKNGDALTDIRLEDPMEFSLLKGGSEPVSGVRIKTTHGGSRHWVSSFLVGSDWREARFFSADLAGVAHVLSRHVKKSLESLGPNEGDRS